MNDDIRDDQGIDPFDDEVADLLIRGRPVPTAAFRSRLKQSLLSMPATRRSWARGRVRLLVASYSACGTVLLLVAAIGVGGGGPLAAG